jgi:hypothetical protein
VGYRGEAAGYVLEAPTAGGLLRMELAPRLIKLSVGQRALHIAEGVATVVEHRKNKDAETTYTLRGALVVARDVPREDLAVWVEVAARGKQPRGMVRIFGVEPKDLLADDGLAALAGLDRLAQRLRIATTHLAGGIECAVEVGSSAAEGLDKVLLADHGDHYSIYARQLFRERARFVMAIHADGRVAIPGQADVVVRSRFGVTVYGDYVRFADPDGTDLAKVSIPWISPEDRRELARRIGQLVDTPPNPQ